jgi:hypothetical protein
MESSENNTLSWFETASIITGSLLGVLVGVLKVFGKKKDNHKENIDFIQVHSQIHESLTELRIQTDAARTQVIQFHNGEYFMDGVSMRKFSLTHESLSRGVSADDPRIKGLLCSMFVPLMNFVIKNEANVISVYDIPHSFCKQFFEENNVEGFVVLPLKVRGQLTAFVLTQWCSEAKLETVDHKLVKQYMDDARNAIEVQLSQQKKG